MSLDKVFVDSSGLFSVIDRKDPAHKKASSYFTSASAAFVTTDYIFDEVVTLLRIKVSHPIAVEVGDKIIRGGIKLIDVSSEDREAAWDYFKKHRDKKYSFTDCTSFCLMKRLGIEKAFSFDKNFIQAGFSTVP